MSGDSVVLDWLGPTQFRSLVVEFWNKFMLENASRQLHWVVDAYYHAITARWPRLRYRCGWDSILFWIPISFLPTELADWIFRKMTMDREDAPKPAAVMAITGEQGVDKKRK